MDSWVVVAFAEISAINAEIQGMVALNQYRISRDETIAYNDDAFQEKAQTLLGISNYINQNRS